MAVYTADGHARRRIAQIYRVERERAPLTSEQRLAARHAATQPLWDDLHAWLKLERARVHDGSATARAPELQPERMGDAHAQSARWPDKRKQQPRIKSVPGPWEEKHGSSAGVNSPVSAPPSS